MATVGIRELRDNVSAVIRRVSSGESIEVTDHGHPVARLVPLRGDGSLAQMISEGRARPAEVDLLDYLPPPQEVGEALLSEVLARLREDER
ncbi:MAG TPA: type II toxin-antitoxin system prevent-host-death family antitoxin [Candidatus Dormibacteraeota bacterium]|nr:type II toxin-antitoxin system prevent-host-death family antitoxin [Candidatus Dormibacteraeota bacterium]